MRKTFIYIGFAFACVVVVAAFVTSKNTTQLIGSALLYPPLVYFALKIFPRKAVRGQRVHKTKKSFSSAKNQPTKQPEKGIGVVDIDKRAFLKLIGATGLSFFVFSLLGRRVESLLFGGSQVPTSASQNGNASQTQPTEGYRISEIDDSGAVAYYGFTNDSGAWFIMKEDANSGSFRYARGNSGFPSNWSRRQKQKYDYFHNLF